MDRQQQEVIALAFGWRLYDGDAWDNDLWLEPWQPDDDAPGELPNPLSACWALSLQRLFCRLGYVVVISEDQDRVWVSLENPSRYMPEHLKTDAGYVFHKAQAIDAPVLADSIVEGLNGLLQVVYEVGI